MSRPRAFDHDAARARLAEGVRPQRVAHEFGVTPQAIHRLLRPQAPRPYHPIGTDRLRRRANPARMAVLGVDGRDPIRSAREAAVSARLRALRDEVRIGGPLLCGPLQIAAAHAAGLTLDDIHEVFAVPPAEAARAIAAHAGR